MNESQVEMTVALTSLRRCDFVDQVLVEDRDGGDVHIRAD